VLIKRAKEDGIPVTAETVVHYVTLDDSATEGYNTNAKMSMPLRSKADVEGLLRAVEEGVIDALATDHAPHEADSKNVEFDKASFGIIGLQTAVPLLLAQVRERKLSLKRLIEALTVSPARCLNLAPNSVVAGKKADLTIIDPERKMRFTEDKVLSKSKNSPFLGAELQGFAVKTIVGGRQVFDISELSD
jgi:dihydroorotase